MFSNVIYKEIIFGEILLFLSIIILKPHPIVIDMQWNLGHHTWQSLKQLNQIDRTSTRVFGRKAVSTAFENTSDMCWTLYMTSSRQTAAVACGTVGRTQLAEQ